MTDPGFVRGPTPQFGAKKLLFGKVFAENYMKMKEIEPRGAGARS